MTIDTELVTEVQLLADETRTHRVKTLIACYVGFISLLESNPELEERARKLEKTLRAFRSTGFLPLSPAETAAQTRRNHPSTLGCSAITTTMISSSGQ